MADSSDTGSCQSFQVENISTEEKKADVLNRFYALYSFHPKSKNNIEEIQSADEQINQDGGSSLSILATNMTAGTETDLRKFIAMRLTSKNRNSEEGTCCSIGLSSGASTPSAASCYYSTFDLAADPLGFDHVGSDGKSFSDGPQMYVLCFVSFQENSLDLFQSELDSYCQGLRPLLDKEPLRSLLTPFSQFDSSNNVTSTTIPPPLQPFLPVTSKLSQLDSGIVSYLEKWPLITLDYLTRTLEYMGENLQQLIYSSLLNAALQISGATPEQEEDVKRFSKSCSLSSLLEQLQTSDAASITGSSDSVDIWQIQPIIVTMTINDNVVSFDHTYNCQFCKNAADKLMTFDPSDVTRIKDFLESVKLAFIHNLNKLKRFLKQAELDHYALFRALSYLKKCGCGSLILRYVKLDAGSETKAVLSVLENFISSTGQTLT